MLEWFGENLWAAWLSLTFVLLVLEVFTLDMLFLMLSAGALAAMTVSLAGGEAWIQVVVAAITALLMLGAVRPVALKHLRKSPPDQLTNIDRMQGMEAHALEAVTDAAGLAEVDGGTWTARAVGAQTIEAGATAVVESVDGATVYLKPAATIDWAQPQSPQS